MIPYRTQFAPQAALLLLASALPAQLTWRDAGAPLPPRAGHHAFFDDARGRVTVFGGQTSATAYSGDCWQLDLGPGGEGPWVQSAALAGAGRAYGACCDDPRNPGTAVVFGGTDVSGTLVPATLRWNRATLAFDTLSPASSPPLRWITAMALDTARGRAVLFGGGDYNGPLGDTWEWNGSGWRDAFPSQSPPARANHAMAYDAARGQVVLYGGHNGASLDDTWVFDGRTWSDVTPMRRPGRLHDVMLAYDENRRVVVLFGGKDDTGTVYDAVWEWDGSRWNGPIQPATRPAARELGSLTYDRQRRCITLVGGQDQAAAPLGDAWQWDGTRWTQLLPGNRGTLVEPSARHGALLAYSELNNRTVLFGGYVRVGPHDVALTDTWERAGGVWQQRLPSASPPPSLGFAGAMLRGTGSLCVLPGVDGFGTSYHEQWAFSSAGQWSMVPLQGSPVVGLQHQVLGSLYSSQFGWVLVRLATSGSFPLQASTLQIIVPNTGTVQTMFPAGGPPPLVGSTMAQSHSPGLAADRVWLFGGRTETPGGPVYSSDLWELADTGGGNLAWTLLAPAAGSPVPPPRQDAALGCFASNGGTIGLVVTGGRDATSGALADSWYFLFGDRTWRPMGGGPPAPRRLAASTAAGFDQEIFGGTDGVSEFGDHWSSGYNNWRQHPTPDRPTPRVNHLMVYDRANRSYVVYGGDTWRYDGARWSPFVGYGAIPWWRPDAAACYDDAHATMVMFGGGDNSLGGGVLGDTRLLSASGHWSTGVSGPSPRTGAAMVYVASQQRVLLFGGAGLAGSPIPSYVFQGDTWIYDVGTDQWQQGPAGPPARAFHGLAYDRHRDRVVLFGGRVGITTPANDTWEFQGASGWQQVSPAHQPPARWYHSIAYDEGRARTVMCGGLQQNTGPGFLTDSFGDVWEWDGSDWSQRHPETRGTGRIGTAMVYDPDRARLAYFGGAAQFSWFGPIPLGPANSVDAMAEIDAVIDPSGPGNTAAPEALRFYSQPVLGQPLRLGFANAQGFGFHTIGFGPMQQPLGPLPVPPLCEPSSLYATAASYLVLGTAEPNIAWTVPNTPLILGVTLVFQAFAAQPANCWRATDALHVRF